MPRTTTHSKRLFVIFSDILIIFFVLFIVAGVSAQVAAGKFFWKDEIREIFQVCQFSWKDILSGKMPQAGKTPLYYLLQGAVVRHIPFFDSRILIFYRAVSILSACGLAICMLLFVRKEFGIGWGLFVVVSLISQNLFYLYSTENRPYMLWVFTFLILLISTVMICRKKYEDALPSEKWFFASSCLAVTLVIAMGIVQVGVAVAVCWLAWHYLFPNRGHSRKASFFLALVFSICVLISIFYGSKGVDAFDPAVSVSQYDFINTVKRGNLSLIMMPIRILLPKFPRDGFFGSNLTDVLVFIGFFAILNYWGRRKNLNKLEFDILIIGLVVFGQVLATIPIAMLIAFLHYWFVQRIFLYLIVCHPLMAFVGGYFTVAEVNRRWLSRSKSASRNYLFSKFMGKKVQVSIAFFLLFLLSFFWHRDLLASWRMQKVAGCSPLKERLPQNLFSAQLDPDLDHDLQFVLNISKRLDECGWLGESKSGKISLWHDTSGSWYLSERISSGGFPAVFCGYPAQFKVRSDQTGLR